MSRDVSTSPHSRRRVTSVTLAMLLALVSAYALPGAQAPAKKALTVDDYTKWRSITDSAISGDGKWATYTLQLTNTIPAEAKPVLHLRNLETNEDVTVQDATGGTFSADSKWIAYQVDPALRSARGGTVDRRQAREAAGRQRRLSRRRQIPPHRRPLPRRRPRSLRGPSRQRLFLRPRRRRRRLQASLQLRLPRPLSLPRPVLSRLHRQAQDRLAGPFDKLRTGPRKRCIDNPAAARRAAEPGGRHGAIVAGHRVVHVLADLDAPDPPSSSAGRAGGGGRGGAPADRRRTGRRRRRGGRADAVGRRAGGPRGLDVILLDLRTGRHQLLGSVGDIAFKHGQPARLHRRRRGQGRQRPLRLRHAQRPHRRRSTTTRRSTTG